jgi:hypothetical protein
MASDSISLTNNMKWHMAYAIDGYNSYPGSNIHSRLNRLSMMISIIQAVFRTYFSSAGRQPIEYLEFKVAIKRLEVQRMMLRRTYLPAFDTNPYLFKAKTDFECKMDKLQDDIYNLVNAYGLTGGYSSANLITELGKQTKTASRASPDKAGQIIEV